VDNPVSIYRLAPRSLKRYCPGRAGVAHNPHPLSRIYVYLVFTLEDFGEKPQDDLEPSFRKNRSTQRHKGRHEVCRNPAPLFCAEFHHRKSSFKLRRDLAGTGKKVVLGRTINLWRRVFCRSQRFFANMQSPLSLLRPPVIKDSAQMGVRVSGGLGAGEGRGGVKRDAK